MAFPTLLSLVNDRKILNIEFTYAHIDIIINYLGTAYQRVNALKHKMFNFTCQPIFFFILILIYCFYHK